jgi:hypothetical protein
VVDEKHVSEQQFLETKNPKQLYYLEPTAIVFLNNCQLSQQRIVFGMNGLQLLEGHLAIIIASYYSNH